MEMVCARVCVSEPTMSKNIHESMVELMGCWRRRHHRRQRLCAMIFQLDSNQWWWWIGVLKTMMMITVLLEVEVQRTCRPQMCVCVCQLWNLSANLIDKAMAGRHVCDCVCAVYAFLFIYSLIWYLISTHTTTSYRYNVYPDRIPHSKLMTIRTSRYSWAHWWVS